jgi:hypothetical protein
MHPKLEVMQRLDTHLGNFLTEVESVGHEDRDW